MLYGLFFLIGVLTTKLAQLLLNMTPLYKLWKASEIGFLKNLIECETLRNKSLQVVKVCYEEANKLEDFSKVEAAVNSKFIEYEEMTLQIMKAMLPYETSYTNTREAIAWLKAKIKIEEITDV